MSQARESHNGINGPILEAETEIRGNFSFLRVLLNFDFSCFFLFLFLSLMRSYQVEEHSIQQWLEARDRIGFKTPIPLLLVLTSISFLFSGQQYSYQTPPSNRPRRNQQLPRYPFVIVSNNNRNILAIAIVSYY